MRVIGYSSATAWIFPAIIDTAVAVSTLMLVALGDKPARRARTVTASASAQTSAIRRVAQPPTRTVKAQLKRSAPSGVRAPGTQAEQAHSAASIHADPAQTVQDSAQTQATHVGADLAFELIASGATTQPVETVLAVLEASRDGASINAAARASRINYRTAQRIVEAAAAHRQRQLVAIG